MPGHVVERAGARARNRGFEVSRGECVVFVDPDRTEAASPLAETIPPLARAKVDLTPGGKFRWNEISSVEQEYPRAAACYGAAGVLVRDAVAELRKVGIRKTRDVVRASSSIM